MPIEKAERTFRQAIVVILVNIGLLLKLNVSPGNYPDAVAWLSLLAILIGGVIACFAIDRQGER